MISLLPEGEGGLRSRSDEALRTESARPNPLTLPSLRAGPLPPPCGRGIIYRVATAMILPPLAAWTRTAVDRPSISVAGMR